MRRIILGVGVAALVTLASPAGAAGKAAPSAREISPLLIGETLPRLELKTSDGAAFSLNAAVKKKRTVLIVYRGGW
jgi:hypothetical protein